MGGLKRQILTTRIANAPLQKEKIGGKLLDGQRTLCGYWWRPGGDPLEKENAAPEGAF
jgi:hypothetical protein